MRSKGSLVYDVIAAGILHANLGTVLMRWLNLLCGALEVANHIGHAGRGHYTAICRLPKGQKSLGFRAFRV